MSQDRPLRQPQEVPSAPPTPAGTPLRVVISGGGTAGHIYPALAVAHALRASERGEAPAELLYLHGPSRRDHEGLAHAGIEHKQLDVGPIVGTAPHRLAFNLLRLIRATAQAIAALGGFKADAVLATGGYVSAPAILAAWLRRVPIALYLPDASPGVAVRAFAPLATRIALSFPITKQYFKGSKAIVTGYPVRHEDRKSTRLNSSHLVISYAVFCLK